MERRRVISDKRELEKAELQLKDAEKLVVLAKAVRREAAADKRADIHAEELPGFEGEQHEGQGGGQHDQGDVRAIEKPSRSRL